MSPSSPFPLAMSHRATILIIIIMVVIMIKVIYRRMNIGLNLLAGRAFVA